MRSLNQFRYLLESSFEKRTHPPSKNSIKSKDVDSENNFQMNVLNTSLRRMEFVNFFESIIDENNQDKYSLGFLLELDKMKNTLQLNTLDVIHSV